MSTRLDLFYPKEGEGSWGFYLELLENIVHFEISAAGVHFDVELMPYRQWCELGFQDKGSPLRVEGLLKPSEITSPSIWLDDN